MTQAATGRPVQLAAAAAATAPMVAVFLWMYGGAGSVPDLSTFFMGPLLIGGGMIFWLLFLHLVWCRDDLPSLGFRRPGLVADLVVGVLVGIALAGWFMDRFLEHNAREEVLDSARIMLQSAIAVRGYTINEVRPLLALQQKRKFLPQTVPAYAPAPALLFVACGQTETDNTDAAAGTALKVAALLADAGADAGAGSGDAGGAASVARIRRCARIRCSRAVSRPWGIQPALTS